MYVHLITLMTKIAMFVISTQCAILLVLAVALSTGSTGGLTTGVKVFFNLLSLVMFPLVYQVCAA